MIRSSSFPRGLLLAAGALLLLAGCGVKNPTEVPQDAGPEWEQRFSPRYGGGYQQDGGRVAVETPPPAYFPGAEDEPPPERGILTFPMPNQ